MGLGELSFSLSEESEEDKKKEEEDERGNFPMWTWRVH